MGRYKYAHAPTVESDTVSLVHTDIRPNLCCSFGRSSDTHHSNSFTAEHFVCIHDDVVSYVGQDVDHCDNRHRNGDGQGQIPTMKNKTSGSHQFRVLSHILNVSFREI